MSEGSESGSGSGSEREQVVHISDGTPLTKAVSAAFGELREAQAIHASIVFPATWRPSVDIVPHIVAHASMIPSLKTLVLVHASAAMSFIASTIGLHLPNVLVRPSRTLRDAARRRMNITLSGMVSTITMKASETAPTFVRRGAAEMREKGFRDVLFAFLASAEIASAPIGDILVEELLQNNTLRAMGLVHPTANLEVIATSVRLRLSRVKIIWAPDTTTAENLVLLA